MYVKLFNRILDSSLAENPKLRHFFIDLLLCADPDGNVIMTNESIRRRINAPLADVEWGLEELQKPDSESLTPAAGGKRIVPLEGHGYGWKIVNFEMYRDYKSAKELRAATAERVAKHRAKKNQDNGTVPRRKNLRQAIQDARADGPHLPPPPPPKEEEYPF